jgi:hypothetical protein
MALLLFTRIFWNAAPNNDQHVTAVNPTKARRAEKPVRVKTDL